MAAKQQKSELKIEAMVAAIEKDAALCVGQLVNGRVPGCGHVGRCALGALLFHGGMTNVELETCSSSGLALFSRDESYMKAARILRNKYGITTALQVNAIVDFNDDYSHDGAHENNLVSWQKRAVAVKAFFKRGFKSASKRLSAAAGYAPHED